MLIYFGKFKKDNLLIVINWIEILSLKKKRIFSLTKKNQLINKMGITRCCCCIRLRPGVIIINTLWTLYGIYCIYAYSSSAVIYNDWGGSIVNLAISMAIIYSILTLLSLSLLIMVSTNKIKNFIVFKSLAYTIALFYGTIELVPMSIYFANRDAYNSLCEAKSNNTSVECKSVIDTLIVSFIVGLVILAVFSFYFALVIRAFVLKRTTENRPTEETREETLNSNIVIVTPSETKEVK